MKKRLILTADDYGMCDPVNDAIDECMAAGTVTSTCVMPNMGSLERVTTLKQRFPEVSVGLHWTLTQGRPLCLRKDVNTLITSEGEFFGPSEFRRRWVCGKVSKEQLRRELIAQYEKYHELAGEPEYWNTHHGSHLAPFLYQLLVKIAGELGIRAMRTHRRVNVHKAMPMAAYYLQHPISWAKGCLLSTWARAARRKGMKLPDGLLTPYGYEQTLTALPEIVARARWKPSYRAMEFLVHPSTTAESEHFRALAKTRVTEYEILRDPTFHSQLQQADVELTSFSVL